MERFSSVTVIWSPYDVGIHNEGVGKGPQQLRASGLITRLESLRVTVHEHTLPSCEMLTGEINRSFAVLRQTAIAVQSAVSQSSFPLVIAGNCVSSVGVASGLGQDDLHFLVFDAHDDLHSPSTTTSGHLDGMTWSILAGKSFEAMTRGISGFRPFNLGKRLMYCGIRDCSSFERRLVAEYGIPAIWGECNINVDFCGKLKEMMSQRPFSPTLVHLDLDVIDESVAKAKHIASPGGFTEEQLLACMRLMPQASSIRALTVASFDPSTADGHKMAAIAVRGVHAFILAMVEEGQITR